MRSIITGQNVGRYRKILEKESDDVRRKTLKQLLAGEEVVGTDLTDSEERKPEEQSRTVV